MIRLLNKLATAALMFVALVATTGPSFATLIKSDFFSSGDGLLITDTATDLQWLSPYATRT